MKHAIVLQHAPFEGPARIAHLLAERGYTLDVRALYRGAPVPSRLAPDEVLVVMGGPMGVADVERPELPFLRPEIELLMRCIADDAPVLGVCLGAQLMAHAAGAAVYPALLPDGRRAYEVGWAPVRFHVLHGADPVLDGVPAETSVLHWHGDTFDLPRGARLLASTAVCRQQAFQLGTRGFGLQFHCEVADAEVEQFLQNDGAFAVRANGPGAVERIRGDTARHLPSYLEVGDRLLRNLLRLMTA